MERIMAYDEFGERVHEGIVTPSGNCPITPLLVMLQGKWRNQVLCELCINKPTRFGELKKNLGSIANTMLTFTLRELEEDGLITRKQFHEIPPHVEYSFAQKERDLMAVFYAMMNWGLKYENDNEKS